MKTATEENKTWCSTRFEGNKIVIMFGNANLFF